jgi:hypothetical protein
LTLIWFALWLIWDRVGDREQLLFEPVNFWTGALILALALDLGRAGGVPSRSD